MCVLATLKDLWFELFVVKASAIADIAGGMPALFLAALQTFWGTPHHMAEAGVRLELHDTSALHVFAKLGIFIADEAAIHMAYACKGSSGFRPCLLCSNVYNARTVRTVAPGDVPHHASDWNSLRLHTAETLSAVAEQLADVAASGTAAALDDLQTRLGWTYAPMSVLWMDPWRTVASPHTSVGFDVMHVFFVSNGVFNRHVGHMVHHIKRFGITFSKLFEYMCAFHWPGALQKSGGQDVFSQKRSASTWNEWCLKASASECLSIVPVLGLYFQSILDRAEAAEELRRHAASFLLLAKVVELVMSTTRTAVDASAPKM